MELQPYLDPERVLVLPELSDRQALLKLLAEVGADALPDISADELLERLLEREQAAPIGTREGVAFLHLLAEDIESTIVIIALVPRGMKFGKRAKSCDLVFCSLGNSSKPWDHVRLLARMARIVHTESSRKRLRSAKSAEELFEALIAEDRRHG